jgi:hypothetical protein
MTQGWNPDVRKAAEVLGRATAGPGGHSARPRSYDCRRIEPARPAAEALLAEVRVLTVANGDPQAEPPHRALTANTGQGLSQASGPRPPRAFRLLSPWFVAYWIEFDPKAPRCPIPPIRW